MRLALLHVATLALVCSSWAMEKEDDQKDLELPGKVELKRYDSYLCISNFWMKNNTIGFEFFMVSLHYVLVVSPNLDVRKITYKC